MSTKHFMSYGDAETIFTGYANDIKGKQDTLTFDDAPTSASSNPVTSGGLYTALGTKANESMIGDAWTASTTYGVAGNTNGYPVYCINNNVLYKCIQEHTGAAYEPPNATYWEETDVNTEITALNNSLTVELRNGLYLDIYGKIKTLTFSSSHYSDIDFASLLSPYGGLPTSHYANAVIMVKYDNAFSCARFGLGDDGTKVLQRINSDGSLTSLSSGDMYGSVSYI